MRIAEDLVDFVMTGARRWHGDGIVVLLTFMVYGFNYKDFNIKVAER